jgi:hypothetical protein
VPSVISRPAEVRQLASEAALKAGVLVKVGLLPAEESTAVVKKKRPVTGSAQQVIKQPICYLMLADAARLMQTRYTSSNPIHRGVGCPERCPNCCVRVLVTTKAFTQSKGISAAPSNAALQQCLCCAGFLVAGRLSNLILVL